MASPYTLAQQTVNTAAQWQLEFTWPRMTFREAEIVRAWLDSLHGQVGTFLYRPRAAQASALTGHMLNLTGYNYNSAIEAQGWGPNADSQLRTGQHFQIGEQLLQITSAPANADANGRCTIEFVPPLRANYPAGTAINFQNPAGKFRLTTSDGIGFMLDPDRKPDFGAITAREAVE
jgi:hypothetical protein